MEPAAEIFTQAILVRYDQFPSNLLSSSTLDSEVRSGRSEDWKISLVIRSKKEEKRTESVALFFLECFYFHLQQILFRAWWPPGPASLFGLLVLLVILVDEPGSLLAHNPKKK